MEVTRDNFIEKLYKEYFDHLVNYCSALLGGDREAAFDCVQETFLVATQNADKLKDHPNPGGWLMLTAKNRVKRAQREKKRKSDFEVRIDDLTERYESALHYIQDFDEKKEAPFDVARGKALLLDKLTQEERELYKLRYEQDMTYEEISKAIGLSESATRMRALRLTEKIKLLVNQVVDSM